MENRGVKNLNIGSVLLLYRYTGPSMDDSNKVANYGFSVSIFMQCVHKHEKHIHVQ